MLFLLHDFLNKEGLGFSKRICLFVISTHLENYELIVEQFESYDPSKFGLHVNIYNRRFTSRTMTQVLQQLKSHSITVTYIPGIKPKLWKSIGRSEVDLYEYVWFLDDDLIFSKNIFPFDQFIHIVREYDAVISTPKIIRDSKDAPKHKGTVTSETIGSQFFEVVDVIEIDSFMFKSDAWVFFHENILIDTPNSDWGPDCVWCQIFNIEPMPYGNISCLRSSHYGIIHTDSKTNKMSRALNKANTNALQSYSSKMNRIFHQKIKLNCHPKISKHIKFDNKYL